MHLPPPHDIPHPASHAAGRRPSPGTTHSTAKIESVGGSAGSNGDASVKRRSGVRRAGDGKHSHSRDAGKGRASRERDGRANYYHLAAATALPTTAARATTRPLHLAGAQSISANNYIGLSRVHPVPKCNCEVSATRTILLYTQNCVKT